MYALPFTSLKVRKVSLQENLNTGKCWWIPTSSVPRHLHAGCAQTGHGFLGNNVPTGFSFLIKTGNWHIILISFPLKLYTEIHIYKL